MKSTNTFWKHKLHYMIDGESRCMTHKSSQHSLTVLSDLQTAGEGNQHAYHMVSSWFVETSHKRCNNNTRTGDHER